MVEAGERVTRLENANTPAVDPLPAMPVLVRASSPAEWRVMLLPPTSLPATTSRVDSVTSRGRVNTPPGEMCSATPLSSAGASLKKTRDASVTIAPPAPALSYKTAGGSGTVIAALMRAANAREAPAATVTCGG